MVYLYKAFIVMRFDQHYQANIIDFFSPGLCVGVCFLLDLFEFVYLGVSYN